MAYGETDAWNERLDEIKAKAHRYLAALHEIASKFAGGPASKIALEAMGDDAPCDCKECNR